MGITDALVVVESGLLPVEVMLVGMYRKRLWRRIRSVRLPRRKRRFLMWDRNNPPYKPYVEYKQQRRAEDRDRWMMELNDLLGPIVLEPYQESIVLIWANQGPKAMRERRDKMMKEAAQARLATFMTEATKLAERAEYRRRKAAIKALLDFDDSESDR